MKLADTIDFVSELQDLGITLSAQGEQLRCQAPSGALTPTLRREIGDRKAELLRFLQTTQDTLNSQQSPIKPVSRETASPLSFAQQRLWFLEKTNLTGTAYNMPLPLHLVGQLQPLALQQSLNQLIVRHEPLRTTFAEHNGTPTQVIGAPFELDLPIVDLRDLSPARQETQLQQLLQQENQSPFNLELEPPIRAKLFQLGTTEYVLLVLLHHIAADGWSMTIFAQELSAHYQAALLGQPVALPDLTVQYADFAVWQRRWLQGETLERQLRYWQQKLQELTPLQLPTDHLRPTVATFHGARQSLQFSAALTSQLNRLSQKAGATLFMILLAAFKVLLFRYSGQARITVGSPIANRNRNEIEGLIGFFTNSLVLHTDLSGDLSFTDLLTRVQQTALDAYAHQDLPFEKLVDELQPERSLSRNPLFDVMFALQQQEAMVPNFSLPNLEVSWYHGSGAEMTTRFDLELHLWPDGEELKGFCAYNRDLFESDTISRMLSHYQTLVAAVVADPNQPISQLPLMSASEQHQLLAEWNTPTDALSDQCIHQHFEVQVQATPDAIAVVCQDQQLTYAELNHRANQVAHTLQEFGVVLEMPVGLLTEPSLERVIGLLGILKAGGASVPLDFRELTQDFSSLSVVVTQRTLQAHLLPTAAQILCLDTEAERLADHSDPLPSPTTPHQLAYILDGIEVEHQAVTQRLAWLRSTLNLSSQEILLHKSPLTTDVAIAELFLPLCSGGSVVIPTPAQIQSPEQLQRLIAQQQISLVHLWPSELSSWLNSASTHLTFDHWRWIFCSGEHLSLNCLSSDIVHSCTQRFGVQLRQFYSLPEAGGEITDGAWERENPADPLSVGRLGRSPIYLLDPQQQLVPIGVTGEIYVGGSGLARETSHLSASHFEAFIGHPEFGRLYRTGELGRRHHDGCFEIVGSKQRHVWIQSRRVGLGAIEAALLSHPSVDQAYLLTRGTELIAYVVAIGPWLPQHLHSHLQQRLPNYMLPASYVPLSSLPITSQGTVDEVALSNIPVFDTELVQRWEAQLKTVPEITQVAVVVQPKIFHFPPLHLSDMLPAEWVQATQSSTIALERETDSEADDILPLSHKPAISDGGPLQWPEDATLLTTLQDAAHQQAQTPLVYITADGSTVTQTYRQLLQDAQRVLAGLRQLGLQPQDKVILQLDNNHDFITALWGCILGGFIPVPVSIPPRYDQPHSTLTKLHNTWQMLGEPLVLTSTELLPKLQDWAHRLSLGAFNLQPLGPLQACDPDPNLHPAQPEEIVLLLLTSGSTGMPKAVTHNHRSLLSRCHATTVVNGFTPKDISLNWFPLDHIVGLVMFHLRDVYLGCQQIHAPTDMVLQQPTLWLDWIDRYRVTVTWAPNFAFELINQCLDSSDECQWDLSCLNVILNAGEAIMAKTTRTFLQRLSAYGLPPTVMYPSWGMSETASVVVLSQDFTLETTDDEQKFVEVGLPYPGCALRDYG